MKNTIIQKTTEAGWLEKASAILQSGGLVAFPTETVYGLGGNALLPSAAEKIYSAKGRPSDNPLIVHIADIESVELLAEEIPDSARLLMESFWPGPLTIILRKKPSVPDATTGGLPTVAIRMPSHPDALRLIRESGIFIAAPSANLSGRPSPTEASHVIEDMNGRIDMILDGGPVGIGIESTIVDLTGEYPTILRPGFITIPMLESVLGEVQVDKAIIEPDPLLRPKAPGMKYTHYAPRGELTIVEMSSKEQSPGDSVSDYVNHEVSRIISEGHVAAVLTTRDRASLYKAGNIITLGDESDGPTVAARLYSALRECDSLGAEYIFSESWNDGPLGFSIMNRLLKAAGHRIVRVK